MARVFKIAATHEEQRIAFGLASVSLTADGQPLTDLQGDQIESDVLEKAVYEYVEASGIGDVMHDKKQVSTVVDSFVVTQEKLDAMLKACGYEGPMPQFKGAAWWVGFKVNDEKTWERVKSGELGAFSIEGTADRVTA